MHFKNLTSGGNNFNNFPENQLTKFCAFYDLRCPGAEPRCKGWCTLLEGVWFGVRWGGCYLVRGSTPPTGGLYNILNIPLRHLGMARVLNGSHSFTCTPRVHPLTEQTIPAFAFPAEAGTHLPPQRDGRLSWLVGCIPKYMSPPGIKPGHGCPSQY